MLFKVYEALMTRTTASKKSNPSTYVLRYVYRKVYLIFIVTIYARVVKAFFVKCLFFKIGGCHSFKPYRHQLNAVQYSEIAVMEAFELNEINEI